MYSGSASTAADTAGTAPARVSHIGHRPLHSGRRLVRTLSDLSLSSSDTEEPSEDEHHLSAADGKARRRFSASAQAIRHLVTQKRLAEQIFGAASSRLLSDSDSDDAGAPGSNKKGEAKLRQPKQFSTDDSEERFKAPYWPPSAFDAPFSPEPEDLPAFDSSRRHRGRSARHRRQSDHRSQRPDGKRDSRSLSRLGPQSAVRFLRDLGLRASDHPDRLFVDQDRAAAHTTETDIRTTLLLSVTGGAALLADASNWRAVASQAELAQRRGRHRYAAQLFTRALQRRPPPPVRGLVRLRLGRCECLIHLGETEAALDDAAWVAAEEPGNARAGWLRGDALLAAGEPERALVLYHRGRQTAPRQQRFHTGIRRCEHRILKMIAPLDTLQP